jgi:hypothetical protein
MTGSRVIAAVAGTVALGVAARYTWGGALLAPIGMAAAWAFLRRGGGRMSRGVSWFAAAIGVEIALLALIAFVAGSAPAGTLDKIQHAADSATANPAPPPAWIERIAPGATARAANRRVQFSGTASTGLMIIGFGIGTGFVATVVGTLGWLATLPLAYAITGYWIGAQRPDPPPLDDAFAT